MFCIMCFRVLSWIYARKRQKRSAWSRIQNSDVRQRRW